MRVICVDLWHNAEKMNEKMTEPPHICADYGDEKIRLAPTAL